MEPCTKVIFRSYSLATAVAGQMTVSKGAPCRVHTCRSHGNTVVFHTTTSTGGKSPTRSKGDPVQRRFRKHRARIRQKFPVEVWEGEGGALRREAEGE